MIDAFALTGRIVFGGLLPQGVALGYVLLPLRGVLLRLLTSLWLSQFSFFRITEIASVGDDDMVDHIYSHGLARLLQA